MISYCQSALRGHPSYINWICRCYLLHTTQTILVAAFKLLIPNWFTYPLEYRWNWVLRSEFPIICKVSLWGALLKANILGSFITSSLLIWGVEGTTVILFIWSGRSACDLHIWLGLSSFIHIRLIEWLRCLLVSKEGCLVLGH